MGTMIQGQRLGDADFRGERFRDHPRDLKGNNDLLALTQPALIESFHRQYFEAGADIVETNTFNPNAASPGEYCLEKAACANQHGTAPPRRQPQATQSPYSSP